jgi:HEAT repeat protein
MTLDPIHRVTGSSTDPSRKFHVMGLRLMLRELEDVLPGSGTMTGITSHSPDHGMSQSGKSWEADNGLPEVGGPEPGRRPRPSETSAPGMSTSPQSSPKPRAKRSDSSGGAGSASTVAPASEPAARQSPPPSAGGQPTAVRNVDSIPAPRTGVFQFWGWRLALRRTRGGSSRQATRRVKVLGEIGATGLPHLGGLVRPSLDDTWVIVREAAAKALGSIQDREAVPALVNRLSLDDSPAVRQAAAWALCQLKDPVSIPQLLHFVQSYPKLSLSISEGIFQMGREGVPALMQSLEDGDPGVQATALDVLGRLGDPRSVRPLVRGLTHPEERVRIAAARSLGQMRDRRVELPLRQALAKESAPAVVNYLLRALCQLECEGDATEFHRFLQHSSPACREAACQLIARWGDNRSYGPLALLLTDSESAVRRGAALALGQLATPQSFAALAQLLGDPSDEVRAASCQALGGLEDSRAVLPLCRALTDNCEAVRSAAATSLGRLGDQHAVPRLCEAALLEMLPEVQIACIRALGQLAAPASLPTLKDLLRRPTQVKTQAVVSIGQLATAEAVEVLLPLLEDPQGVIRYHAILALGNIGDQRAIPAIERRISDPETLVLRGVVRATGQFATAQAKVLKSRAEAALRSSLERPAAAGPVNARSQPSAKVLQIPITQAASLGLVALLMVTGLGVWWGRDRSRAPVGAAQGASLAFSRGDIAGLGASFNANELRVITSGGWLERWNPDSGQLLARAEKRLEVGGTARFSRDGSVFVTPRGKHLAVCDSVTGEERTKVVVSPGLRWLRLDSQGQELATWESDRGLTLWSLRSEQPIWQIDRDPDLPWCCVAVTEDFGRVALGLPTGDVLTLDTGSKRRLTRLKSVVAQPTQLEFSPDGKVLAVVSARGELALVDPVGNRVLERANGEVTGISALVWTHDGERVIGVGNEAALLVERRGGRIIRMALDGDASRSGITFDHAWVDSSDRYVAAASSQGRIVLLWSLPSLAARTPLISP